MSTITKEQLVEDLKASTQNSSGMFEIGEDTICNLMSMLTNAAPQLPQPTVPDIATVETTYPDVQTNWQDAKMYAEGWNACRAAMLQGAEPVTTAYKLPPHIYRELVNRLRDTAVKYQGCQQLREQLSRTLQEVIQPAAPQQGG